MRRLPARRSGDLFMVARWTGRRRPAPLPVHDDTSRLSYALTAADLIPAWPAPFSGDLDRSAPASFSDGIVEG